MTPAHAEVVKLEEDFKPSAALKSYNYASMLLIFVVGVLSWYIPLLYFGDFFVAVFLGVPILIIFAIWAVWIPWYYTTVVYRLTADEISWRRGVWFKRTGIVPYSRITNIDIVQGPVMRAFGISSLRIQTAGYSGQATSEISIEGMTRPEEVREMIMGYVRPTRAAGDATGVPEAGRVAAGDIQQQMLEELVRIRTALEKNR
jgi:membrane protein YdbS with pleckstrin-like domain